MTRTQADHDADVRNASTVGGERGQSRRRPLPRQRASLTDDEPGGHDVVSEIMDSGPGGIIGELTHPTDGLRGHLDGLRRVDAGRVAAGVHPDVDDHTSCATCTEVGEPEVQLDVSGDERIASGQAEEDWLDRTSRHREGTWPRPDSQTFDRVEFRRG